MYSVENSMLSDICFYTWKHLLFSGKPLKWGKKYHTMHISHVEIVYRRNNQTNDFNLYEKNSANPKEAVAQKQWWREGNAEILLHWSFPSA